MNNTPLVLFKSKLVSNMA